MNNADQHPPVMPLRRRLQRGFGAMMAIVILVILSSLAAGMVTLGTTQQLTAAQDVLSARAFAAARAGLDVGMFRALSSLTPTDTWKNCNPAQSIFLDLSAVTGFHVGVTCTSLDYNDGQSSTGPVLLRVFQITATACNSTVQCPDNTMATTPGYVERVRQVTVN